MILRGLIKLLIKDLDTDNPIHLALFIIGICVAGIAIMLIIASVCGVYE